VAKSNKTGFLNYNSKYISKICSQALVAHAYNPSYLGGTNQEDRGSKPAQASSLRDPISKTPLQKKGWWSGSSYRPWAQTNKQKICNKLYIYSNYFAIVQNILELHFLNFAYGYKKISYRLRKLVLLLHCYVIFWPTSGLSSQILYFI
jgi:hypothetical protein